MAKKRDADPDVELATPGFVEEFCTKPTFDEDGVQVSSGIGRDGKELPDPVPMAPPVGFTQPPDLMEMMRRMILSDQLERRYIEEGVDTLEEAGDFDIDDDPLPPLSPWEAIMQPLPDAPLPASPPPSPAASPQVETAKGGGEEAGSPQQPAPAAPSGPPPTTSRGTNSTST